MINVIRVARSLVQFVPLSVFLYVAFLNGTPQAADWLNAFVWGGSAAVLHLALSYFLSRGRPVNRITLGVDFYLILGGMAVVTNQMSLLTILNNLKESGIFLCLLAVGSLTTVVSKFGFVGVVDPVSPTRLTHYSVWMLLLTCAAVVASFWFRGKLVFSAALPLIGLSVANQLLRKRCTTRV